MKLPGWFFVLLDPGRDVRCMHTPGLLPVARLVPPHLGVTTGHFISLFGLYQAQADYCVLMIPVC